MRITGTHLPCALYCWPAYRTEDTILQNNTIILRQLGLRPYHPVSEAMHQFTEQRTAETGNEIWLVEHERVLPGPGRKAEHVLAPVISRDPV